MKLHLPGQSQATSSSSTFVLMNLYVLYFEIIDQWEVVRLFPVKHCNTTLPPMIMEVETGVLEDVFSLQMGYFPLP